MPAVSKHLRVLERAGLIDAPRGPVAALPAERVTTETGRRWTDGTAICGKHASIDSMTT